MNRGKLVAAALLLATITLTSFLPFDSAATDNHASKCFGTTAKGHLEGGVKLPFSGPNFVTYSYLAGLVGRTYVHSAVREIILNAYQRLKKEEPDKVYKYAETGYREGGPFKPHKTHRNGLSVDFMTPVVDANGKSAVLPTNPFNKYGYDIEFDSHGKYKDLTIDYDALAAHIVALDKEAKKAGFGIRRVIFDPKLQPNLFKTKYGAYLKKHVYFFKRPAWIRHDEHYHVDFNVPCAKL